MAFQSGEAGGGRDRQMFRGRPLAVSLFVVVFAALLSFACGCVANKLIARQGAHSFEGRVTSYQIEKLFNTGYVEIRSADGSGTKRFESDPLTKFLGDELPRTGDYVKVTYLVDNEVNKLCSLQVEHNKPAAVYLPPPRSAAAAKTGSSERFCSDIPDEEIKGFGRVKKVVNVRSGASTSCAKLSQASPGDRLRLLGKKDRWYYLELPDGTKGWMYSPLVQVEGQETTISAPAAVTVELPEVKGEKISIAVLDFSNTTPEAAEVNLGKMICEKITTALVNSDAFKTIEREQLTKVVSELELGQTGIIDTSKAIEIGKIYNADAIIVGSAALMNNEISLDARIIEVESGVIISAESRTGSYSLSGISAMSQQIVNSLARKFYRES